MADTRHERFLQTEHEIEETILELLKKKEIHQISVVEVCQSVHINRSTFYDHFTSVYDAERSINQKMNLALAKQVASKAEFGRKAYFTAVFRFIHEHEDYYQFFFQRGGQIHIDLNTPELSALRELSREKQNTLNLSGAEADYSLASFRAGANAMLQLWLKKGCAETEEELYEIMIRPYDAGPR